MDGPVRPLLMQRAELRQALEAIGVALEDLGATLADQATLLAATRDTLQAAIDSGRRRGG